MCISLNTHVVDFKELFRENVPHFLFTLTCLLWAGLLKVLFYKDLNQYIQYVHSKVAFLFPVEYGQTGENPFSYFLSCCSAMEKKALYMWQLRFCCHTGTLACVF